MLTPIEIKKAIQKHGSQNKAAAALGIPKTTFQNMCAKMRDGELLVPELIEKRSERRPRKGYVKRYIFTAAQDNTPVHKGFWTNLVSFADWCQAEVIVAPFTYLNQGRASAEFAEEVQPYLSRVQLEVAGKLLFCGEVNTNPTAVHPLAGLETYTRDKWGVFPHPRVELRSIATMFSEPSKQIMTTGAVTMPNYLPRKAGVKAEFHHVVGALLVEVDGDGDIFCRHLQAEKDGAFYDLDVYVVDGKVSEFNPIDSITWGDIHSEQVDPDVARASWGVLGMLDTLHPKVQFVHDLSDFSARNHHDIHDPHKRFKKHTEGNESVADGLAKVVQTLLDMQRKNIECVIVESNHDLMLQRWLKEADFRSDPGNAIFYLETQLALYRALHAKDDDFSIFEWAVRRILPDPAMEKNITFLREYSSYKRLNIEYALHGHKGANGARGHINSFAKMGSKANVAHTHGAAIHEGIYQAGTSSKLDLGYNRGGLSSWNHAHIVTYKNGKRVIVTLQNGKWRA